MSWLGELWILYSCLFLCWACTLTTVVRNAVIIGPAETPFEDGTFRLVLQFDEQYPNKPPTVRFISDMFHPNVYASGELCLDILQNRWSPTYDVAAILTSIQRWVPNTKIGFFLLCCLCFRLLTDDYSLLNDPNTSSPANVEAANLYRDHRSQYSKRVRQTVENSWNEIWSHQDFRFVHLFALQPVVAS